MVTIACGAALGGCQTVRPELGKPYPAEAPKVAVLDVQVFREVNRLRLTNTSGVTFGPSTVWVNAAYALPIDGLAIGDRLDLHLGEFRNEYGQTFRAGGFFSTQIPTHVVKAEIVDDRGRYEMIVVRDEVE